MPRFSDEWVVDRTMYEFVAGSGCACCGLPSFMPGGVQGLIKEVSDLETDAANQEISALETSPWPPEIRNQIWADRLRLRHYMKKEMHDYQVFWEHDGEAFQEWLTTTTSSSIIPPTTLKKMLQMPRSEIVSILNQKYNIHSALVQVITAVVEQVAHFPKTGYLTDAPSNATSEVDFEHALTYDRRGGFTLDIVNSNGSLETQVVNILVQRIKSLGGPKLLERAAKTRHDIDDSDDEEVDDVDNGPQGNKSNSNNNGPSFRSDRRIVRLLIARYWADILIEKYKALNGIEQATDSSTTGANERQDDNDGNNS